ncbi:MAG: hypothetical protein ACI4F3_08590 [Enterocloster sp.]
MKKHLMKKYVWLNPVVLKMYGKAELEQAVRTAGYEMIFCKEDHIRQVKEQYRKAVARAECCVMDQRCPAAAARVKKRYPQSPVYFPNIDPILIQSALELAERVKEEKNASLTVVTPCSWLSRLGKERGIPGTSFMTWLEFAASEDICLETKELSASPIPPGFFSGFGESAESLASRSEIDQFFLEKRYRQVKIVEMFFCDQGCHHGDGIREGGGEE